MVTDLPDYEKKVVVVTVPGGYPALMEVDVVKVDGVAIATPTVVACLPVSIEHVVDINHLKIKGVTLKDPTEASCLPVSIEHIVRIDHQQIKGLTLKDPTVELSVPVSWEGPYLAYEPCLDAWKTQIVNWDAGTLPVSLSTLLNPHPITQTDPALLKATVSATLLDIRLLTSADVVTVKSITDALPAGSNAIGKLAANNGVDIGDVDVKTMPDVTQSDKTKLLATVTQAEKDRTITGTVSAEQSDATKLNATVKTLHDLKTYKTAMFDASASGNLVAAVADKVIKLHALTIQAQNTVTVNLNNGSGGSSLMEWSFQAREGAVIPMATAPAFWAKTGVNTALYVTLSAAVTVTITAIYSDDDAT